MGFPSARRQECRRSLLQAPRGPREAGVHAPPQLPSIIPCLGNSRRFTYMCQWQRMQRDPSVSSHFEARPPVKRVRLQDPMQFRHVRQQLLPGLQNRVKRRALKFEVRQNEIFIKITKSIQERIKQRQPGWTSCPIWLWFKNPYKTADYMGDFIGGVPTTRPPALENEVNHIRVTKPARQRGISWVFHATAQFPLRISTGVFLNERLEQAHERFPHGVEFWFHGWGRCISIFKCLGPIGGREDAACRPPGRMIETRGATNFIHWRGSQQLGLPSRRSVRIHGNAPPLLANAESQETSGVRLR